MASIVLKRTNQKMPLVGFGLWKVNKDTCADTVFNAIKSGYRLFDGAGDYGNEKEAGEGVKRALDAGLVKREELFITSKLWNTFHQYDRAKEMAKYQLGLWGLDYFDLFLVHFPIALAYVDPKERFPPGWTGDDGNVHLDKTPFSETWKAMEELVDEGLAKNIGVSNTNGALLLDIMRYARIPPQVAQIELHPYLTQEPFLELAKTLGIAVTAYSSFGPQGWVELGMSKNLTLLMEHESITSIASKYTKTPAQVLLRWATQQGLAVIPKSNSQTRLVENMDCVEFTVDDADMKAISSLNKNLRLNNPAEIDPHLAIFA
jgi:D-xylose reductase